LERMNGSNPEHEKNRQNKETFQAHPIIIILQVQLGGARCLDTRKDFLLQ
jgi:hypothetical protein